MIKGRKIIYKNKVKPNPQNNVVIPFTSFAGEKIEPIVKSSVAGFSEKTNVNKLPKEKKGGSKLPVNIFAAIVFLLGFYVIYDQFIAVKDYSDTQNKIDNTITKIDNSKEFVYYTNQDTILTYNSINYDYKDIVININNDVIKSLNEELTTTNKSYKDNYTYISKENKCAAVSKLNTDTECLDEFTYRRYNVYENSDYITIVIIDTDASVSEKTTYEYCNSFIINRRTGLVMLEDELFDIYYTSRDELLEHALKTLNLTESTTDVYNDSYMYIDNNNKLGIYFRVGDKYYNNASMEKVK